MEASAEPAAVNSETVNTARAVIDVVNRSFMGPSVSHAAAVAHRRKYVCHMGRTMHLEWVEPCTFLGADAGAAADFGSP
jgi:hypothetical protein